MKKYVAYYRVSTDKQGIRGLGIEAQKTAVQNITNGGELIAEFTEVESGRKKNRPELNKALEYAKAAGATLIVAKLDRLSRDVSFLFNLRTAGVDFVAGDIPELTTLTLGIYATFAQHEAERISQRTKDALAELKKQGVVLGQQDNRNLLSNNGRQNSIDTRQTQARDNLNSIRAMALIKSLKAQSKPNKDIVKELNNNGYLTPNGCKFTGVQVNRLWDRVQREHPKNESLMDVWNKESIITDKTINLYNV